RQVVVEAGLISVMQHIHNVRATYPCRIVQTSVIVTTGFQVFNTGIRMMNHVFLGTENNCSGWTGFNAGRFLTYRDSVGTQGALIRLVIFLRDTRYVERTARNTVATTN